MINWRLKDEIREAYKSGLSIKLLSRIYKRNITYSIIPMWMREEREERERARKQRIINNRKMIQREKNREARERRAKLNKSQTVVFMRHIKKHSNDNAVVKFDNHMSCPANRWLMGASNGY